MKKYNDAGLTELASAFSEVLKNNYDKGYLDGKKTCDPFIQMLKGEIDNGLAREILLRNKITKLENQIKKG